MQRIKCCVIGNIGVGKTSIIHALMDKSTNNPSATVGIDFFSKIIYVQDSKVHLSIWDTAGAEQYRSLTHTYVRDAQIILIVYDTTDENMSILKWIRIAERYNPAVVGIIGNKNDLTLVPHNLTDLLAPWSRQPWVMVTETCSSRRPTSVKKIMHKCVCSVLHSSNSQELAPSFTLVLPKHKQKQSCCT